MVGNVSLGVDVASYRLEQTILSVPRNDFRMTYLTLLTQR